MDNIVKTDLRALEKGLDLIEMAHTNGLRLVPNGGELKLKKDPNAVDYNKEQADVAAGILKQNKQDVLDITADRDGTQKLLAQSQARMSEAHDWLMTHIDLWDRLETAYRTLFGTTECVMGAGGCREDAVVRCKACEGSSING